MNLVEIMKVGTRPTFTEKSPFCSSLVYQSLSSPSSPSSICFLRSHPLRQFQPRETAYKDKRDNVAEHFSRSVTVSPELYLCVRYYFRTGIDLRRTRERNDPTKLRSARRIALFSDRETKAMRHSRQWARNQAPALATNTHRLSRQCARRPVITSGFLRRRARRDWASRGHPVRRVATLGNGAVAHRACVTLLRAYNHLRVSLSPAPACGCGRSVRPSLFNDLHFFMAFA